MKWTKITEDESTWPPKLKPVIFYSKDGYMAPLGIEKIMDGVFVNLYRVECRNDNYGLMSFEQWRPMPEPPKNKLKAKEETIEVKRSFLEECLSLLKESKSPWKPRKDKPKHTNEVLVRHKLSTGEWLYGIGCIFREEWSWDKLGHIDEWMEIPE